jgi:hypothetical protein
MLAGIREGGRLFLGLYSNIIDLNQEVAYLFAGKPG